MRPPAPILQCLRPKCLLSRFHPRSRHIQGKNMARLFVRGSYSARVPRSSLAEVHREFVQHIVEEEADGQEERQDDRREYRQQRKENGEVAENQTHNMSARR